jgi:hypothetical protein
MDTRLFPIPREYVDQTITPLIEGDLGFYLEGPPAEDQPLSCGLRPFVPVTDGLPLARSAIMLWEVASELSAVHAWR